MLTMPNLGLEKTKARLRMLLALSLSPNKHEAKAAMSKAVTLMLKHDISEHSLSQGDIITEWVATKWVAIMYNGLPHWVINLYCGTARALGCCCAYSKGDPASFIITGRKADIERVKFIVFQMESVVEGSSWKFCERYPHLRKMYSDDYKLGLVARFTSALNESIQEESNNIKPHAD